MNIRPLLFLLPTLLYGQIVPAQEKPPYLNPDLPFEARVDDLVGRMTLDEKISQTLNSAPAIERLGIPAYDWWNEALHGVARAASLSRECSISRLEVSSRDSQERSMQQLQEW